jgi:uncharacterized protein (TIGR00369 family)
MERTRTQSWADPKELAKLARSMSGLEFLRFLALVGPEGKIPMASTLPFRITEVKEGRVVFVSEVGEHLYNPIGIVHGSFVATLMDGTAGSEIHTLLPAGTGYVSLDMSVHHLRPITIGVGPVRAIGTVVNRGRRSALAHAELRDSADRILAHGVSSCIVVAPDASRGFHR